MNIYLYLYIYIYLQIGLIPEKGQHHWKISKLG